MGTPKVSEAQGQILQMSRYAGGDAANLWLWGLLSLSLSQINGTQGATHPL